MLFILQVLSMRETYRDRASDKHTKKEITAARRLAKQAECPV